MVSWLLQMDHLARAEDLRRAVGPHDVIVRARLDVIFSRPLVLAELPLTSSEIHAIAYRAVDYNGFRLRPCEPTDPEGSGRMHVCDTYYRDWFYVASPTAMAALASASQRPLLHNISQRCKGWCQEEQVQLQLWNQHVHLTPILNFSARVERVSSHSKVIPAKGAPTGLCGGAGHTGHRATDV
jgi:hypothetical protein